MFDILYLLSALTTLFFVAYKPKISIYPIILSLIFFTLFRELSSGSVIFFIIPYLMIGLLLLRIMYEISIENLKGKVKLFFFLLNILVLIFLVGYFSYLLQETSDFSVVNLFTELDPIFIEITYYFACFMLIQFFILYFLNQKIKHNKILLLDVWASIFLLIGFIYVSLNLDSQYQLVNSFIGFRYYFSMALIYFVVRHYHDENLIKRFFKLMAFVLLFGLFFSFIEGLCLNCFDMIPSELPWSGQSLENFGHGPIHASEKTFFSGNYSPIGFMYSQHLTGIALTMGLAMFFVYFLTDKECFSNFYNQLIAFLLVFLPIGFIYTSKTTLIVFIVTILLSFFISIFINSPRAILNSFFKTIFFVLFLPFITSYYLLPCATHNLEGEINFLTQLNSVVYEEKYIENEVVYKERRVMPNAFLNLKRVILEDIVNMTQVNKDESLIFGQGYSRSQWMKVLTKADESQEIFQEVSESDTPYLKFLQQFGFLGLLSLVTILITPLIYGFFIIRNGKGDNTRPLFSGLVVMVFISALAMIHLQVLFKTGVNTIFFIAVALISTKYQTLLKLKTNNSHAKS